MQDSYSVIDGIRCYSLETKTENTSYNATFFDLLFNLEEKNFWFRSRNIVIRHLVKKFLTAETKMNFLEIGCGTGYVLKGLTKFKNLILHGSDIFIEGLKFARKRLPEAEFIQVDATKLPFRNEYDCIGAFDVLEHIEDDAAAIESVHKSLKKNGLFFISVPQYMFMWSQVDNLSFHKRRYSKKEITGKLKEAGFKIEYATSFVFTLFPLLYLIRYSKKKGPETYSESEFLKKELKVNPVLNHILYFFMLIDAALIKLNFRLPAGGSLFLAARKG